jgi:hypothetical protein
MIDKITSEIFQVGGGGLTSPEDAAVYLINIDDHAALVDAGCGGSVGQLIKHRSTPSEYCCGPRVGGPLS